MQIHTRAAVGRTLLCSLNGAASAIAACAGPRGGAFLYEDGGGISIARGALEIVRQLAQTKKGGGAAIVVLRETLFEADRDLGDGGARLALLLCALVRHGTRLLEAGVEAHALSDALIGLAGPLKPALQAVQVAGMSEDMLPEVARAAGTASLHPAEIARLVTAAGPDGYAEILPGRERGTSFESGSGFLFDAEPAAGGFVDAAFDPVNLLVADEIVEDLGPLLPLLEGFATRGKALLVVAREIRGAALQALVRNHREAGLRAAALKPVAVGQHAADILEDLATVTGATLVADRFGTSLKMLRPGMLGRADRFALSGRRALLEGGGGDADAIAARRLLLLIESERQKYLPLDRERLERRAALISGRWARLHHASATMRETETDIAAARRALVSARMAQQGGAIEGGGLGLLDAIERLPTGPRSGGAHRAAFDCFSLAAVDSARAFAGLERREVRSTGRQVREELADLETTRRGSVLLLDPLPLTLEISRRALSGAATLLRADAVVSG